MSKNTKGKTVLKSPEPTTSVDEAVQNDSDAVLVESAAVTTPVEVNAESEVVAEPQGEETENESELQSEVAVANETLAEEEVVVVVASPVATVEAPAITFAVPEVPELTPVTGQLPAVTQFFYDLIDGYVSKMRPGVRVSEAEGRQYQRALLRIYQQVLARDGEEFVTAMNALLARFNDHRGLTFSETYVFRFLGAAGFEANQSKMFQTFTTLCMRICDPKSRALRIGQEISQAAVLDKLLNEEQRQRLQGYLQSYL